MPTSPKKIAANRRNAQKSTGPKTPEGKARSSENAVKHALYARKPILKSPTLSENPAYYNSLRAALIAQFAPSSPLEHLLVHRLANSVWHLERAEKSPCSQFPDIFNPSLDLALPELLTVSRRHYHYLLLKRRLRRRMERTHALLKTVKRSQSSVVCQQLVQAISERNARCETNPLLDRVL